MPDGGSPPRIGDLTRATVEEAPPCCVDCTWWQRRPAGRGVDKRRWADGVEGRHGPWGKLYRDEGRVICLLQYGPADAFPRAASLPAGPPSSDAVLVTCSFLVDPSSPWALQSLLLACIGEARDAGYVALEAFAYRHDEGESYPARFLRHRTVFPRDFLADLGFRSVRAVGRVELVRLELRGLVPVEVEDAAWRRAWVAWRERRRGAVLAMDGPAAPAGPRHVGPGAGGVAVGLRGGS